MLHFLLVIVCLLAADAASDTAKGPWIVQVIIFRLHFSYERNRFGAALCLRLLSSLLFSSRAASFSPLRSHFLHTFILNIFKRLINASLLPNCSLLTHKHNISQVETASDLPRVAANTRSRSGGKVDKEERSNRRNKRSGQEVNFLVVEGVTSDELLAMPGVTAVQPDRETSTNIDWGLLRMDHPVLR
jgi:hypothetical protein